ncbi:MAG: hypothetical protein HYV07_14060 [Deltaproteobacteria bacterium]|nr:hypothetical protein [Deltaproteobacteria bacterium]
MAGSKIQTYELRREPSLRAFVEQRCRPRRVSDKDAALGPRLADTLGNFADGSLLRT